MRGIDEGAFVLVRLLGLGEGGSCDTANGKWLGPTSPPHPPQDFLPFFLGIDPFLPQPLLPAPPPSPPYPCLEMPEAGLARLNAKTKGRLMTTARKRFEIAIAASPAVMPQRHTDPLQAKLCPCPSQSKRAHAPAGVRSKK